MIKLLVCILVSCFSGILYRLGGKGKPFNTKYRDFGTPLCGMGVLVLYYKPLTFFSWVMWLVWFGLAFASMTTYWDKLFKDKDNFYMHGFMAGLSAFPLFWTGIHWYAILIGAIICGALMGIWSKKISQDWLEESGRGFIYCISRLCLLI